MKVWEAKLDELQSLKLAEMKVLHLLPVGKVDVSLLEDLCSAIPRILHVSCEILPVALDPAPAYHAERQQYHSSEILQRVQSLVRPQTWRLLAVADVDLYIPILKYVFGERGRVFQHGAGAAQPGRLV